MTTLVPVLLAGGSGTRLWPLSREAFPKQFLKLGGEHTLLQQTALRARCLDGVTPPVVICGEGHRFIVAEQLREIGIEDATIILEPEGRNTAPAAAVAALHVQERYGADALVFLMSADHAVANVDAFCDAARKAAAVAATGKLMVFGIKPTRPETGYGYLKRGKPLGNGAYELAQFVEKPNAQRAQEFLSEGGYDWNGGLFLFPAGLFLEELTRFESNANNFPPARAGEGHSSNLPPARAGEGHSSNFPPARAGEGHSSNFPPPPAGEGHSSNFPPPPAGEGQGGGAPGTEQSPNAARTPAPLNMVTACHQSLTQAKRDLDFIRLDAASFKQARADSIDYALMEKTDKAALVPMDAGWDDVGSWSYLATLQRDARGNYAYGDVLIEDSDETLIHSEHRMVAALGLQDVVIVETKDAVLVTTSKRAQDVKAIVAKLRAANREEAHIHPTVHRPWGSYETIALGPRFQVKRIIVKPGRKLSSQMHHHRAEHWIVVCGTAKVTCDDKEFLIGENQSTYIPLGGKHRLENPGKVPLELIEVQSGSYLGEDDIVRFDDVYGRS